MELPTGETTNRRGIGFPWEKVGLGNGEWGVDKRDGGREWTWV